jgi:hypothetical protein
MLSRSIIGLIIRLCLGGCPSRSDLIAEHSIAQRSHSPEQMVLDGAQADALVFRDLLVG